MIAHRGASGKRPEHTLAAYELAIAQGADFIEPDLVPRKDGVLVCRHANEVSGTTDVAARPEFAERRALKRIDGVVVIDWFTEDFTLAELKTWRARERLPGVRPANATFDGDFDVPTFGEALALAMAHNVEIYPEAMDLQVRVVGSVAVGMSRRGAATRLGISAATAVRWAQLQRDRGSTAPKRARRRHAQPHDRGARPADHGRI